MIALEFKNINVLKQKHFEAIRSYVCEIMRPLPREKFYQAVIILPGFETYSKVYETQTDNFKWLEQFILADTKTLESWVRNNAELLRFDHIKKVYLNRFSKGSSYYVDDTRTYNSYTLFRMMDLHVCPYCEHEFFEEVDINGQKRRTAEFDHFFPKGKDEYPGLAMCFYNLVPSCKPCNQLKMTNPIAASPYDPDIEKLTYLSPDLPVGINMTNVTDTQCEIKLHAMGNMILNEQTLALEQRYKKISSEVHRLLKNHQDYPDEKLEEMERMGFGTKADLKYSFFGNSRNVSKGKELHTKMKEDLIGY